MLSSESAQYLPTPLLFYMHSLRAAWTNELANKCTAMKYSFRNISTSVSILALINFLFPLAPFPSHLW